MPGFTQQIGHLVSMMAYTRSTTLTLIESLSMAELDYVHDDASNSIGALLMHIAAIEYRQQVWSFEHRDLDSTEQSAWEPALKLGELARTQIRGYTVEEYVEILISIRAKTYRQMRARTDAWLSEEIPGMRMNQYFRWFHVLQDEISHRGQMKWLIQRIPTNIMTPVQPSEAHPESEIRSPM